MKSHLRSYSGPLTATQIVEGIAAAQTNAYRLIEDAKVLFQAKRYPTATALSILSMEERGKVIILKRLALSSDSVSLNKAWKDYRSHRAKNAGWIIPNLVRNGARTMQAMAVAVETGADHTAVLDALKQVSFYTDCLGDQHWSIPNEVIDEEIARSMIALAEIMWCAKPVTLREVELWQQIVGPHNEKPTMAAAVLQWQSAMVREGLSDTSVEELAVFINSEPNFLDNGNSH